MFMKKVLAAAAMSFATIALMSTDAFAAVTLLHCKAPTNQLELFIPYSQGGVNPIAGTIRLTRVKKTFIEASNEDIVDYFNDGSNIAFKIVDQNDKVVLDGKFSYNEARQRYVGSIVYGHLQTGMTCVSE